MNGWRVVAVRVIAVVVALALGAGIGLGARRLRDDDDDRPKTSAARRDPGPLPSGRFTSRSFPPVRSLTVASGWRLDIDSPDILELSRVAAPLGSIGFGRPTQVFDDRFLPAAEAMATKAKVRPLPADLVAYFRSIPEVQVYPSTATQLDGVPAETFGVALKPLPPDNTHLCGRTRCMFWGRRGTQLFALFENDVTAFTVLRVRGQALVIAAAAPLQGGEAFVPLVNEVLRTVKLRRE